MNSIGAMLMLCVVCIVSVDSVSIPKREEYPSSDYPYDTTTLKPWPTSDRHPTTKRPYSSSTWWPWPTDTTRRPYPSSTYYPYSTTRKPYPSSTYHPDTSTWWPWPTDTTRWPYPSSTHYPYSTTEQPTTEHCYGHYIYKEEHNIIVDGEDDRHTNPEECELACTVSCIELKQIPNNKSNA